MICDDLARTGTDFAWAAVLLLALMLVVIGLVLRHGARGRAVGLVLLLACVVGASTLGGAPAAQAACPTPAPPANSLTIVQTSVNTGMMPTEAPSFIAGRVTNNGPDETFVTAIVVSIGTVVKAPGAVPGVCDASDYVLFDPRMPVGEQLAATGGSALFTGARIGFLDKTTNQNACKGAVVELLYRTD